MSAPEAGGGPRVLRTATGVRIALRVQPRAATNGIAGVHGDALKVRVTAAPADGAANEAVIKLLATTFGIPARDVTIVAGASSRNKVVELEGVTEERVRRSMQTCRKSKERKT